MTLRRTATALSLTATSVLIVALTGVPAPSAPVAPDRTSSQGAPATTPQAAPGSGTIAGARVP
ncbi:MULTISPECIES: hypothetical protein [unclassified Embleya]|uniref:hypothetical protein n=1 Tax=unclassified Embleya TaxID=2699296 RepID=UPI0036C6C7D9